MPREYEALTDDEFRDKFIEDKQDKSDTKIVDFCPLCVEGGPYKLMYGKDETGSNVKQCPVCKTMFPIHKTGRIDTDITTSQEARGTKLFTGLKFSDITRGHRKTKLPDCLTDQTMF